MFFPYTQKINEIQNHALSNELTSTPTSVSCMDGSTSIMVSLVASSFTSSVMSSVSSAMSSAFSKIGNLGTMNSNFTKVSDNLIPAYYQATNLDNFLGSVTHINAQDVITKTTKMGSAIGTAASSISGDFTSKINNKVSDITTTASKVSSTASQMQSAKSTINAIQAGSKYGLVQDQHSGVDENLNKVKDNADKISRWSTKINSACNSIQKKFFCKFQFSGEVEMKRPMGVGVLQTPGKRIVTPSFEGSQ